LTDHGALPGAGEAGTLQGVLGKPANGLMSSNYACAGGQPGNAAQGSLLIADTENCEGVS
jgi:hypothetical protein